MSLMSNLVSGAVGATIASVAKDYIAKQGGLQNVLAQFEQHGLGEQMKSWISTGQNLPISAEQISKVLGGSSLGGIAEKLGIAPEKIHQELAEHLPKIVDEMTPAGAIPASQAA